MSVDDDEVAWVHDTTAIVWPLQNILNINPFRARMTPAARLNAQARLTILIGLAAYSVTARREENSVVIMFWTLLYIINQGMAYVLTEISQNPPPPTAAEKFVFEPDEHFLRHYFANQRVAAAQPLPPPPAPSQPLSLFPPHTSTSGVVDNLYQSVRFPRTYF